MVGRDTRWRGIVSRTVTLLVQLRSDRRGSAIAMMTAGFIPVVAALGAGIDIGRAYMVKSQLQAGVDAAALAGARAFGVNDQSASSRGHQARAYFDGNFADNFLGSTTVQFLPEFEVVNGIYVTTISAHTNVPTTFMRIFGFRQQPISAVAKAELQPRPLEAMVVLDDTGSMRTNLSGGRTRMTALKEAASDFVTILHQGAPSRRDLALGFIGYDVTVNVGHLLPTNAIQHLDGFSSGLVTQGGAWPTNRYGWKGCVMNDSTVRDVNATRTVSEPGAWDLVRSLPGEGSHPRLKPYFIPPMYVPSLASGSANAAQKANAAGSFYRVSNVEPGNNLYKLDASAYGATGATYLANSEAYRQYFYYYYIGLNNGSTTSSDDVIRRPNGGYYNPATDGMDWVVDYSRLPNYSDTSIWKNPSDSIVNPNGGRVDNRNQDTTPMPSPNWQCPEEAMPIEYGRPSSEYINRINNKHGAIYPANGTIHHSGLLWAYRLLVRDDVFTRSNPTNEAPRRAIVFMTDGVNEIGESQNGYTDRTFTWYGRWTDGTITANPGNGGTQETQMLRRFEKTCANIQREANPPEVYIIALTANSTAINKAFNDCAPGRVYRTSSTDELRRAFQDVAAELVDLHLIQ